MATPQEALDAIRALCSNADGYTTWDREARLGDSPWDLTSEAVVAWEAAHGHDPRMKCYAEYGCQLLVDPDDILDVLATVEVDNPPES